MDAANSSATPISRARGRRGAHGRGFTFLELVFALAGSMLLIGTVLSVVFWQTRTYYGRLTEIDANQTAATVIAMLQSSGQRAGFGFGHGPRAEGIVPIGQCGPTDGDSTQIPWRRPLAACAGVDNDGRNDRLRIAYIDPWLLYYSRDSAPTAGPCPGGSGQDASRIHIAAGGSTGYSAGNQSFSDQQRFNTFIGGDCAAGAGPPMATDELSFVGGSYGVDGCQEIRDFYISPPDADGRAHTLTCPGGYKPGWTLGLAEKLNFYTVWDDASASPMLVVNQQTWGPPYPWPLARGISRFEVRYGLDLSVTPDGKIDPCPSCTEDPMGAAYGGPYSWCRDVRGPDLGGPCDVRLSDGTRPSTRELYNRIVALHVTFDVQTRADSGYMGRVTSSDTTQTRTYQTLVQLRNMRP